MIFSMFSHSIALFFSYLRMMNIKISFLCAYVCMQHADIYGKK